MIQREMWEVRDKYWRAKAKKLSYERKVRAMEGRIMDLSMEKKSLERRIEKTEAEKSATENKIEREEAEVSRLKIKKEELELAFGKNLISKLGSIVKKSSLRTHLTF